MNTKHYQKITQEDFNAIGQWSAVGAFTTDTGIWLDKDSSAYKRWLELKNKKPKLTLKKDK